MHASWSEMLIGPDVHHQLLISQYLHTILKLYTHTDIGRNPAQITCLFRSRDTTSWRRNMSGMNCNVTTADERMTDTLTWTTWSAGSHFIHPSEQQTARMHKRNLSHRQKSFTFNFFLPPEEAELALDRSAQRI